MSDTEAILRNHYQWTDATFDLLYLWWGTAHRAAQSDPARLQQVDAETRSFLVMDFKRHLDTDEGPHFHVYTDGACGWDSMDPIACEARVIYHFLRVNYLLNRPEIYAVPAAVSRPRRASFPLSRN